VRLSIRDRNHVLSMTFESIRLDILPTSLIKVVFKIEEFFDYRRRVSPHDIPQGDRRTLVWRSGFMSVPYFTMALWQVATLLGALNLGNDA
jgi:hypothetical protein